MSIDLNYQSLDVKLPGATTTVPDNNLAKLMYYLDCVFGVIQIDEANKFTDYHRYYSLSKEEEQTVFKLALLFNPKIMTDLSLFVVNSNLLKPGFDNTFIELSDNRVGFHINSEVMIGGVARKVLKIMACNSSWLMENYIWPMESYAKKLEEKEKNSECDCCGCLENSFDTCCCCLDCNCSSSSKRCFCCLVLFVLIADFIGIIIQLATGKLG